MEPQKAYYSTPETQPYSRNRLKVIGVLVVVIFLVFLLAGLFRNRGMGTLIIRTNNSNNAISILPSAVANGKEVANAKPVSATVLQNGRATSLKPGLYIVNVEGSVGSRTQTVRITAGKSVSYEIDLPTDIRTTELVANVNTFDFVVGPSAITYLDQASKNLFTIDGDNHLAALDTSVSFSYVQWADASFGVGADDSGNFYTITNGVVQKMSNLPQGVSNQTEVVVAHDHQMYLSVGAKIYTAAPGENFTQVFTASEPLIHVAAASKTKFAVAYAPPEGSNKNPLITVVSNGKVTAQNEIGSYEVLWSPDGNYLATTEDSNSQIFDSNLKPVAVIPNSNISNMAWLSNSSLAYTLYDKLWRYDISGDPASGAASVIAQAPASHAITSTVVSPDGAYLYASVQNSPGSNNDLTIQRVGLKGQQVLGYIYTLQGNLPNLQVSCILSLTNFMGKPKIQSFGGKPEDECLQVATGYIQSLNLDPSAFNYEETTVLPDEPTH